MPSQILCFGTLHIYFAPRSNHCAILFLIPRCADGTTKFAPAGYAVLLQHTRYATA
jgi:hypothetical protein